VIFTTDQGGSVNPRHTDLNEWDRLAKEEAKREGRAKEDVSNKVSKARGEGKGRCQQLPRL